MSTWEEGATGEESAVRRRLEGDVATAVLDGTDLDRLAAGAVSGGRRLRARRRLAAGAGAALAVTAVFGGVWALTPNEPSAIDSTGIGFAAGGGEGSLTPTSDEVEGGPVSRVEGEDSVPTRVDPIRPSGESQPTSTEIAPVRIVGAGFSCTEPMDAKFLCTTPGGKSASVVWRDASERERWLNDPDKGGNATGTADRVLGEVAPIATAGDSVTIVGAERKGVFVTIQGEKLKTVLAVARHLRWAD